MNKINRLIIFCVFTFLYPAKIKTPIILINNLQYISIEEFSKNHSIEPIYYKEKNKLTIGLYGTKIILSKNCSYIKVGEKTIQINTPIIQKKTDHYILAQSLKELSENINIPKITLDKKTMYIITETPDYNIHNINVEEKMNGYNLIIKTSSKFNIQTISCSITSSGWMNLTITNGLIDSTKIVNSEVKDPIRKIRCIQSKESAQISLLLKSKIDDFEISQTDDNSQLYISLRTSHTKNSEKIRKSRNSWLLDTIVLDAGHGGKDAGAVSKSGIKEKDVNLQIVKKLGRMIKRKMGIRVIYTRDEDIFIPLWKRTKIANESRGKVFISIHANASSKSKKAKGFETYLLRPGKTEEAIEVATRENAVIALEIKSHDYGEYTDEKIILATMAQNEFLKQSEALAGLVQESLGKRIKSNNRALNKQDFMY